MFARKFWLLAIIILVILAGCHFPDQPWVLVEITNLEEGQHVLLNEEVLISAKARSSQGIARVELYINGELTATQFPNRGNLSDLIVELLFPPLT
ncbi:MAG TPA: Ig-like domain-containing protein, partial [Brevefilum sp.]|nr:Ig-like domain-containing protein [Brevefilum sp.]